MGVVEIVVMGKGAVVFNIDPNDLWEESEFNPLDHFIRDCYSQNPPVFFPYDVDYLTPDFPTKFPNSYENGENRGWSITDVNKSEKEYKKDEVISRILKSIEKTKCDYDSLDNLKKFDEQKAKFISDVKRILESNTNVYFGKFLYRYFS